MTASGWSALAIGAAMGWSGPALAPHLPPLAAALGLRRRAAGDLASVHLTFDDGPHPGGTPAVLDALAARRASATFFLVGEQVERYPALAREIAAAGHVIALHGYRHRSQLRVPPWALADDLRRASDVIGERHGASGAALSPALRDLQPRRARAGAAPWRHAVAVVALGPRLAGRRHAGLDRPPRGARPLVRRRGPLARRRPLRRPWMLACDRRRRSR